MEMSALPPKAGMVRRNQDVCLMPKADTAKSLIDRSFGGTAPSIIPAKMRRAAMRFPQGDVQRRQEGGGGERRVQSVGLEWDFYGTVFEHTEC
jgi:hypothetical protein